MMHLYNSTVFSHFYETKIDLNTTWHMIKEAVVNADIFTFQ